MENDCETIPVYFDEQLLATGSALLFKFETGEEWVPRSLISDRDDDEGWIEVPGWLAIARGLV